MNIRRPKFVRQKSFEIDSDSTDIDTSLTPSSEPPKLEHLKDLLTSKNECRKVLTKQMSTEKVLAPGSGGSSTSSWNAGGSKKRPDLTIKIYNR